VFRPGFWRVVAALWLPFAVFAIWDVVRRDFPRSGVTALAIVGAISVLVFAVGLRPAVLADNGKVVVRNPFRTTTLPWNTVTNIDATDALRVHTSGSIVRAWAVDRGGGASNMFRGWNSRRLSAPGVERQALAEMARRGPADLAVVTLTETWRQQRGHSRGSVAVTWAWPVIAALLVLTALSVVLVVTG
jgi:hypothetical protein